ACPRTFASAATAFSATPRLHVVKSASTNASCSTGNIDWSIVVTNRTAAPMAGVVVSDTLPAGLSYVGGSISGRGAVQAGAPALLWNVGTLRPGEGVTLGYKTLAPVNAGALVSNTAEVDVAGQRVATSAPA